MILSVFLVFVLTIEHEMLFILWTENEKGGCCHLFGAFVVHQNMWYTCCHELFWRKHVPQKHQEADPGDPLLSYLPGTLFQNHHADILEGWLQPSLHLIKFSVNICVMQNLRWYILHTEKSDPLENKSYIFSTNNC